MRISDWSADVCSSDLQRKRCGRLEALRATVRAGTSDIFSFDHKAWIGPEPRDAPSRFARATVRRGGFERRRHDAGKFECALDCDRWDYYGGRSALALNSTGIHRRRGLCLLLASP